MKNYTKMEFHPKNQFIMHVSTQQKPITKDQKEMIIKSYDMGLGPTVLSQQTGKTKNSISTFYCRYNQNSTLEPKVKKSRSMIDGPMGRIIKQAVSDYPKYGLRKIAKIVEERAPQGQKYVLRFTLEHLKDVLLENFCRRVDISINYAF
jgi:hypothetical protein